MYGWLIVNAFLVSRKFSELTELFVAAAQEKGCKLEVLSNAQMSVGTLPFYGWFVKKLGVKRPDFVIFWDKDILLASYLEEQGVRVFNRSQAIADCDDKRRTWMVLNRRKIPTISTVIAPMTYDNVGYPSLEFLETAAAEFEFPIVVKEAFGSFGEQVYLAKDREQLECIVKKKERRALLFQKYIGESRGRDVRLQVVGDRVIAAVIRRSDTDFRANVTAGGRMEIYEPEEEACSLAVQASKALGCDFAGVDLLFGKDGFLVCEVNSNAHFKNLMDCTGVNAADFIMAHVIKECEERGSLDGVR